MTTTEKIEFISSLTSAIAEDLIDKVDTLPEEWDGIELRELLADKFDAERIQMNRKRKSDFRNFVNVNFI